MSGSLGRILHRIPSALSISPPPSFTKPTVLLQSPQSVLLKNASRNYALRKGASERYKKIARANKAAKDRKLAAMPQHLQKHNIKRMKALQVKPLFPDQSNKREATDNVYLSGVWRWPRYELETAINNFVQVHGPTMYDNPKALIKAYFELDLRTKKKTQFLSNLDGVVELPYIFDTGKPIKTLCLFCKDTELNQKALDAGAECAVGLEGLKKFQEGVLDPEDYDVMLAHPDFLPELAPIRGLISKKFPNIKKGTVGFDVVSLVKKFKSGVDFDVKSNPENPQQGFVEIPIGLVDMPVENTIKNFLAVMDAMKRQRPTGLTHDFITLAGITSQFSKERFQLNLEPFKEQLGADDGPDDEETSMPQKGTARAR